jgi:hypothetical protein
MSQADAQTTTLPADLLTGLARTEVLIQRLEGQLQLVRLAEQDTTGAHEMALEYAIAHAIRLALNLKETFWKTTAPYNDALADVDVLVDDLPEPEE